MEKQENVVREAPSPSEEPSKPEVDSPSSNVSAQNNPIEVNETEGENQYLQGLKLYGMSTTLGFVAFLVLLDTAILATAIPRITSQFKTTADIGWYASAYVLCNAALTPLSGKIYTMYPLKLTFIIFLAVFEIGSLIAGVSVSSPMFIVGRAISGLGGSGLMNGALTIVAAIAPLDKRPALMGPIISVANIGTVLGPVLGGVLTQHASWRWCFYINLPAGAVVCAILILIHIPDKKKARRTGSILATLRELDILGCGIFAPTVIMLLLALEWGGTTYPWKSAKIIGLLCGSFGLLCVFIAWEYHVGDSAMIPGNMVKRRIVQFSGATTFFLMGSLICVTYYLPVWFQVVLNASPTLSGVMILPSVASQIVAAVLSGYLVSRLGYYIPWALVGAALSGLGAGLMNTFTPSTTAGYWVGYQIINGAGRGMTLQMPIVATQTDLPPSLSPIGTTFMIFSQNFGSALFVSFGATIFNARLAAALVKYVPGADVQRVLSAGALGAREAVRPDQVAGLLLAYNSAIVQVFYLATGASCAAFATSWGLGWKSVKKAQTVSSPGA